ncbi:MAG: cation:proton antiporter, partial [Planctomycetaceae bacterium]
STSPMLVPVLVTLANVLISGQLLGRLCRRLGQPVVIGQVLAGIALGPSLLGGIFPEALAWLIPGEVADPARRVSTGLQVLAQLGVTLFLFLVGLEFDPRQVRGQVRTAAGLAVGSLGVPLVAGVLLAGVIAPWVAPAGVDPIHFKLFLGVALSMTAFPILARILSDLGVSRTDSGRLALATAAVADLLVWCLLALVMGLVQARSGAGLWVCLNAAAFVVAVWGLGRPLARWGLPRLDRLPAEASAVWLLTPVLLCALVSELIGVHAMFGGFLAGVMIPRDAPSAKRLEQWLQPVVGVLLLPAFFALTGLQTRMGLISGWDQWSICLVIVLVAMGSKLVGTWASGRLLGLPQRECLGLGVLMNARGLMELIVLNAGRELGLVSESLYAMMVVMALVTTVVTVPLLKWVNWPGNGGLVEVPSSTATCVEPAGVPT